MAFLFALVLVLILYGSLYPFNFSSVQPSAETIEAFLRSWQHFGGRGDVLGNVALFVPYGFLGMLSLPPKNAEVKRFILLCVIGLAVAAGVQVVQLYLPSRDAALGDVAWNVLGCLIGAALTLPAAVRLRLAAEIPAFDVMVPLALIACWFASELVPFVPTLDLQAYKDSLKPLLQAPVFDTTNFLRTYVSLLVVCTLAARIKTALPFLLLIALGMIGFLLGKLVIVQNAVTLADVAAVAAAYASWVAFLQFYQARAKVCVLLLIAIMAYMGLEPFSPRGTAAEFHWLPFQGSLGGSMVVNASVIARKIFMTGALVYLLSDAGRRLVPAVVLGVILTAVVEVAQVWVGQHTPEITDPLLVVLVGLAFLALGGRSRTPSRRAPRTASLAQRRARRWENEPETETPVADPAELAVSNAAVMLRQAMARKTAGATGTIGRAAPATQPTPAMPVSVPRPPAQEELFSKRRIAMVAIACAAILAGFEVVLTLPRIPYNVRELFAGDNAWWRLILFGLAVLAAGWSGAAIGRAVVGRRYPFFLLPALTLAACLLIYLLLGLSVSGESLQDITGSSNTYWFVMNRDIWGDTGKAFYRLIHGLTGSTVIIFTVEQYVRFVALFAPPLLWSAILCASYDSVSRHPRVTGRRKPLLFIFALGVFFLCASPLLILSKVIAFDYSSTDNLNELIGNNGAVLYLLLVLLPSNALILAHAVMKRRIAAWVTAALVVALSLPIGWFLLKHGLNAEVHKYGQVFSGADFLLGPDRKELMPEAVLITRWCALQLAAVGVLAYGMLIAFPMKAGGKAVSKPIKRPRSERHAPTGRTAGHASN